LALGSIFPGEKKTTIPKQVPFVVRNVLWGKRQFLKGIMNFPREGPKFLEEKHTFFYLGKSLSSLMKKTSLGSNEFSLGKG
jgi:hypothetical protein